MLLGWVEYTAIAFAVALALTGLWYAVRLGRWLARRVRTNWPDARDEIEEMFRR